MLTSIFAPMYMFSIVIYLILLRKMTERGMYEYICEPLVAIVLLVFGFIPMCNTIALIPLLVFYIKDIIEESDMDGEDILKKVLLVKDKDIKDKGDI